MVRLRGLINSPCLCHDEYGKELADQEVYDSLPIRVNGQVWARIALAASTTALHKDSGLASGPR